MLNEDPKRDYIFELHRCIKDHSKLIFKEWSPPSRDCIKEDTEFNMGTVERYTPKIMELIFVKRIRQIGYIAKRER